MPSVTENTPRLHSMHSREAEKKMEKGDMSLFPRHYEPVTSAKVSEAEYCLHLASSPTWDTVAVAVSDGTLAVLQRETLETVIGLGHPHEGIPSGVRFSPRDTNILWTSGQDCLVKMWDVRTGESEKQFCSSKENPEVKRPLTCLDVSGNERILCAGTELTEHGSFILFWDVRGDKLLGCYSDSHTDDITTVKFSSGKQDTLATSATDCLINVFDISQTKEDEALTYCLNTEVVMDKLFWLGHSSGEERLAGLSDMETFQYWDIKESSPQHNLSRQVIATAMHHQEPDDCYLVSIDVSTDNSLTILSGSRSEDSSDCLRSLKFNSESGHLTPHGAFIPRQKLLTTRTSLYHAASDTYTTGGECGVVRIWRPEVTNVGGKQPPEKTKKKHRNKPY